MSLFKIKLVCQLTAYSSLSVFRSFRSFEW